MYDPEDAILMPFAEVRQLATQSWYWVNTPANTEPVPETLPMVA